MKIGLLGTHGTGKSTLVSTFLERCPEYKTHTEEHSRNVVKKGLGINFETTETSQLEFLKEFALMMDSEQPDNFITPRTLIDLCGYNLYFFRRPEYKISRKFLDFTRDLMLEYLNWWDLYVYIPIEFKIEKEDEFRVGQKDSPEYQVEVDTYIKALLMNYDIPHITVTGTVEERIEKLTQHIKEEPNA